MQLRSVARGPSAHFSQLILSFQSALQIYTHSLTRTHTHLCTQDGIKRETCSHSHIAEYTAHLFVCLTSELSWEFNPRTLYHTKETITSKWIRYILFKQKSHIMILLLTVFMCVYLSNMLWMHFLYFSLLTRFSALCYSCCCCCCCYCEFFCFCCFILLSVLFFFHISFFSFRVCSFNFVNWKCKKDTTRIEWVSATRYIR